MTTSIYGIKTITEQPKARIELYLCGDIPIKEFSVEEIIDLLIGYQQETNKLKDMSLKDIVSQHTAALRSDINAKTI